MKNQDPRLEKLSHSLSKQYATRAAAAINATALSWHLEGSDHVDVAVLHGPMPCPARAGLARCGAFPWLSDSRASRFQG